MISKNKVSVIIPAKNEAKGIALILKKVKPYADEILVIDGHSRDGTRKKAEKAGAKVFLDNKKGKGDGIRVGIEKASGEILVFIDADGSHEPKDIPKLIKPIIKGKADLVIGSRIKGGSDEFYARPDSFIRQIGSDVVALITNLRFKTQLTDLENGFRAIKRKVALDLNLEANDFDIEQEMVMKAAKKGYRIAEVPSHEYERKWGKSKLSTRKGWKFIWRLIKELF